VRRLLRELKAKISADAMLSTFTSAAAGDNRKKEREEVCEGDP